MKTLKLNQEVLKKQISNFIDFKKSQKIGKDTIKKYLKVLNSFYIFLITSKIYSWDTFTTDMFLKFIEQELKGSKSIYTRKFINNTIKMFLKYTFEQLGFLNMFENFESIKVVTPEIFPNLYSFETLSKIKQTLKLKETDKKVRVGEEGRERGGKDFFHVLRDKVMLSILIYGGVKLEELMAIRLCDIKLSKRKRFYHITVSRKRRGERVIPIKFQLFDEVYREYLLELKSEYICSTKSGRQLDRREIAQSIENYFTKHNLKYIGIQGFRHSYARKLVKDGYSKERIRYLMGYRNSFPVFKYIALFSSDEV